MNALVERLERMVEDQRIGPVHISVFVALWWCADEGQTWISKVLIMRRAKIQGRTTYYKVMKELSAWGYIDYRPERRGRGVYICF